jgi:TRAP-type C4-dicarboxylate transport system permease small subunit
MNAAFDLITSRLNKKYLFFINIINSLLIMLFAGFYFVNSFALVLKSTDTIAQGLDIPINFVYISQPICAFLLFVFCIEKIFNDMKPFYFKKFISKGEK